MAAWRAHIEGHYPRKIDWWALEWERWTPREKASLLAELQERVPKETSRHLLDEEVRYVRPNDKRIENDTFLQWGAGLLLLGDLEADVLGEPPTPQEEWSEIRQKVEHALEPLARIDGDGSNLTEGDHARRALECLKGLDNQLGLAQHQARDGNELALLTEAIAIAVHTGYALGRHTQAALNKPFQRSAVTGLRQTAHLSSLRDQQNQKSQQVAACRRTHIEQLLPRTNAKGKALMKFLRRELTALGITKHSDATLRDDLAKIRKKSSKAC